MVTVDELKERLKKLEPGSAIALKVDVDAYFDMVTAISNDFPKGKDMNMVYATSTIPAETILNILDALDIDRKGIHFVDAVSYMTMGATGRARGVTFVESPTMLEYIMLKVEYLLKKFPAEENTVVLDSINSLAIHNGTRILAEFLHILVSNLRSYDCSSLIISVAEQESEEIDSILAMVCDDFLEITP
ncbi:MAG: hypothetical protein R6U17_04630 [Thermoplasmata archaeon]